MPFHKSWKQRRRHSSFCSSITEIPMGGGGGLAARCQTNTATTSISASGAGVAVAGSSCSSTGHRNSITNIDGLTVVSTGGGSGSGGVSRRCSEQQQHFVVMDIINEDKVEV